MRQEGALLFFPLTLEMKRQLQVLLLVAHRVL
jgi:hypothetical protein